MTIKNRLEQRSNEAAQLQQIEGNPFDAEDIAMFEMFDREDFNADQRRAYIIEQSNVRIRKIVIE